jgi:anti-sigma B factor antagonist
LAAGAGCKELSNKVAKMEFDLHHGDGRVQPMFRQLTKNASVEEARLDAGEITWHVIRGSGQLTVAVAGRVTVDSSPNLRCLLLDLLRRGSAQGIVIDLSAVSYLDMSGLATLLEALKAARQLSVTLRVTGVSGEARHLAEIAQLDTIFRAWGSEVEYQ